MSTLGENIKKARIAAGKTQEGLAQLVNTTKSAISRYEQGKRQPSLVMLTTIACVLDVRIEDLLGIESIPSDEYFSARWNEITNQQANSKVSVLHYPNGKTVIIDLNREKLIQTYNLLDDSDQLKFIQYGDLLLGQAKYQD